jgi:hypothetical protein
MFTTDTKTALIPLTLDAKDLDPAHRDFQRLVFAERRETALGELRMLSGVPGLVRDLKPDKVYRLVVPDGKVLQQGKDGLYSGVLYGSDGKISNHARFTKVSPSLARMASVVGSQVLLISIAMQLTRVEKAIAGIAEELHNNRIARIRAGIRRYEAAMHMGDRTHRDHAIQDAIQSLTLGLEEFCEELRMRINRLPDAQNTFWENWGGSKSRRAASELAVAEDAFRAAVHGVSLLSQCYAALHEPRAGVIAIRGCLQDIESCGIQSVADKARIVVVHDQNCLPETPWLRFGEAYSDFVQKEAQTPLDPEILERGSVTIEFRKSELLEEP